MNDDVINFLDEFSARDRDRRMHVKQLDSLVNTPARSSVGESCDYGIKKAGGMWHVKLNGRTVFSDPEFIEVANYIAGR